MQFEALMGLLESLGTEQTRKTYRRHSGGEKLFGVSFADIRKLAKQIKRDHGLALHLWATGVFEAQVVATMIADPQQVTPAEAEDWVQGMTGHPVTDELVNNLLSKTPFAAEKALAWGESPAEFVGRAGWHLVGIAAKNGQELPYADLLARIEGGIHAAPNRKREAMNNALIAIGIYRPDLTEAVVAAAGRIGKVAIDHGDTACKTPDAAAYIANALSRKK